MTSYIDSLPQLDDSAYEVWLDFVAEDDELFDSVLDDLDRLEAALTPERFQLLCDAFELCPTHLTDIRICEDDELDCLAKSDDEA